MPESMTSSLPDSSAVPHRIVIVGGGAGGLELATRLGETLGRKGLAHVTLIERARSHFWKPHLHEIAAGSIDMHAHATDYLAQSHWHGFRYRVGEMIGLDRRGDTPLKVLTDALQIAFGGRLEAISDPAEDTPSR